jgi:hypothetical protein
MGKKQNKGIPACPDIKPNQTKTVSISIHPTRLSLAPLSSPLDVHWFFRTLSNRIGCFPKVQVPRYYRKRGLSYAAASCMSLFEKRDDQVSRLMQRRDCRKGARRGCRAKKNLGRGRARCGPGSIPPSLGPRAGDIGEFCMNLCATSALIIP